MPLDETEEKTKVSRACDHTHLAKAKLSMTSVNGLAPVLQRFGFSFERGGPHLARTMMLNDLTVLLEDGRVKQPRETLLSAIEDDNVLGKRTAQSRKLAARHLGKLYALDQAVPLYRAFTFLWQREPNGRPLLALLVAYIRDGVLRSPLRSSSR